MARKRVTKATETNVLLTSRRRCRICFGLSRDTTQKPGQIAHLDRDNTNNAADNLVYLCLDHHDEYDSRTSQRKGFILEEVVAYNQELVAALRAAFTQPVSFGLASTGLEEKAKMIDGHYIRIGTGENASAELRISKIIGNDSQYHVTGEALWGRKTSPAPNIGRLDFIMDVKDDRFTYTRKIGGTKMHKVEIVVQKEKIRVSEENWSDAYGMNVNFIGEYQKAE